MTAIEPGVFHQWIQGGDLGICVEQVIDLNNLNWQRTLYYRYCRELGNRWDWDFPEGQGNILE